MVLVIIRNGIVLFFDCRLFGNAFIDEVAGSAKHSNKKQDKDYGAAEAAAAFLFLFGRRILSVVIPRG